MLRWINRLLERTALVRELRADIEHTRAQRNEARQAWMAWEQRYRRIEEDFNSYLKAPRFNLFDAPSVHVRDDVLNQTKFIQVDLRPSLVASRFTLHDDGMRGNDTAYRLYAEQLARNTIGYLKETLAPHIEKQLKEQLCP